MKQLLLAVAAFLCGLSYDWLWTRCVDCVRDRRALLAANLGIILYVCTLISTVLIVDKYILAIVTYGVGNWVGIYLAVKRKP